MEKRIITVVLFLLISSWFMLSCSSEDLPVQDGYVLQIKDVGLREGVFSRRFQLTNEYGQHQEFTAELLKNFIEEKIEPDYLFIANAYDLGFHEEKSTKQKIRDYRVNLVAGNHPFNTESFNISKDRLQSYYKKKSERYDIDLIRANSYAMADSMYKLLKAGDKIKLADEPGGLQFPQLSKYRDLPHGEMLHPILLAELEGMKKGQTCKPVFTAPIWSVMRLNSKRKIRNLKPYKELETELIKQMHTIIKFENENKLIDELNTKYPATVNDKYYQTMISAYTIRDNHGWIFKDKINDSELNDTFVTIHSDETTLSQFISTFNQAIQLVNTPRLMKEDLVTFADIYVSQNQLYLDALEKGAEKNVLVKDQLVNKEYRLLLAKYLKEEISQKVVVSDADARKHYNKNREKWTREYDVVSRRVVFDLKKIRMYERRDDLVKKLRRKYNVRYNELLLTNMAQKLTEIKQQKAAAPVNPQ